MTRELTPAETAADPVRQRILQAAIPLFAQLGEHGASTRAIADAAGTAMSSITYQFGGKHGLYLAAADYIGDQLSEFLLPQFGRIESAIEQGTLDEREAVLEILGRMTELMLDERSQVWTCFIIREQQDPGEAFDRIFSKMIGPVAGFLLRLVGSIRSDLGQAKVRALVIGLVGQVIALRAARESLMRIMEFDEIGETERALLRGAIQSNARAILQAKGE